MTRLRWLALACMIGPAAPPVLVSGSQLGSPAAAGVPDIALADIPPHIRADIERAHERARAHPADAGAIGRLGMILHAYEQHSLAILCYERAHDRDPRTLKWPYLAGVLAAALGEHERAARLFRDALVVDGGYLPALARHAEALLAAGDHAASRAAYEALTVSYPELAVAHAGLGRVAAAAGDTKAAVAHFERALAEAPEYGRAHYALALAYRNLGLTDRAREHAAAHARLGSTEPAVPEPLMDEVRGMRSTARDLIAEGARLGRSGRLREAVTLHLKALEADPRSAQAHTNLISLYGQLGSAADAETHYRAALALGGSLADAHYNFGVLLAAGGRRDEAAAAFRRTLGIDPFHARAHNNLAALLAGAGRHQEAAAHYRRALASDPQHRGARFGIGRVLVALGRPREAIDHFEKLLAAPDRDTPRHTYALANAWFASGDTAKALGYADAALQSARKLGQAELAARIEQEVRRMKGPGR
jgi:tetratricopeptide (TPR) repeat protein